MIKYYICAGWYESHLHSWLNNVSAMLFFQTFLFVLGIIHAANCDDSSPTASFPPLSTLGRIFDFSEYYTTLLTDAGALKSIDIR